MKYRIQSRGTNHELLIYGDIGDKWDDEQSSDAISVVKQLQDEQVRGRPLDVRINSYGGSVADGLAIFNALRNHPFAVTAHIDGVAFSIASLIANGADRVRMAENAMLMIHAPWGATVGNAEDHREMAEMLDKTAAAMVTSYRRPNGPGEDTIADWLMDGKDHFFTAAEALELGLVDAVTESIDIAAALRGAERFKPPVHGETTETEAVMAEETQTTNETAEPVDFVQNHNRTVRAATTQGAQAENRRIREIQQIFDGHVSDDPTDPMHALQEQCIDDVGCTPERARMEILNALKGRTAVPIFTRAEGARPATGSSFGSVYQPMARPVPDGDQADKFIEGATKAIEIRAGLERDRDVIRAEQGGEFLSMSLLEMCKYSLRMQSQPVHGTADQIIRRALAAGPGQGTDHFPSILENIANKSVMDGYLEASETWQTWTRPGTLNDYRTASRVNKSLFDTLDKMEEFEAFQHGRFADVKQSITGYLHGKSFSLTLQAIVNDDLSILSEDARAWGEAANKTIGDAVWVALTATGVGGYGQTMDEDSTILFHADHGNYVASGSGAAPSKATIQAGRTAMITQTDPNSRTVAEAPRYLLHGTTLTLDVFELLNSQYMITGANADRPDRNAVQSLGLQGVEEYRFDSFVSTAWMLAAGRRTVEVAFVGGQSSPQVDRMPAGEIPGVTWQISIPFGVAALDYRTLYLNYGA